MVHQLFLQGEKIFGQMFCLLELGVLPNLACLVEWAFFFSSLCLETYNVASHRISSTRVQENKLTETSGRGKVN